MAPNSEAETLVQYMSEVVAKSNPLGLRGGEEGKKHLLFYTIPLSNLLSVARAERYALAVIIKHTCMAEKTASYAQQLHKKKLYKITDSKFTKVG